MATSVLTAIAVIPPPALWPRLQAVRSVHDPAYGRWPPHLNLLFPFVAPSALSASTDTLKSALAPLSPFTVSLTGVGQFATRRGGYVYAKPSSASDAPFAALYAALAAAFPECTKGHRSAFQAHLTLGRAEETAAIDAAAADAVAGGGLAWPVEGVYVLRRTENEPYAFDDYVPFGGGRGALWDPFGLVGTTYTATAKAKARVTEPAMADWSAGVADWSAAPSTSVPRSAVQRGGRGGRGGRRGGSARSGGGSNSRSGRRSKAEELSEHHLVESSRYDSPF
ncbi:hypothetical protein H9P43_007549 [Blastocladiella emersonii ATCC 22665]|nr:hypothetical protein H9P43_007549 [Blastocladiella emersonii ATCC 22665]